MKQVVGSLSSKKNLGAVYEGYVPGSAAAKFVIQPSGISAGGSKDVRYRFLIDMITA
jgi:hypothetical protein